MLHDGGCGDGGQQIEVSIRASLAASMAKNESSSGKKTEEPQNIE